MVLADTVAPWVCSWQRNFKISGEWLVTLRLLIFFHNFACPQTVLCSSFSSPCLMWHTQVHNTKVESTFIHLPGFSFDSYIASTCNLSQVSLKEDHVLEMKLFTHSFNRVPMIFSSRFLEFCVKWRQMWLYSSAFLCCPNALKVK